MLCVLYSRACECTATDYNSFRFGANIARLSGDYTLLMREPSTAAIFIMDPIGKPLRIRCGRVASYWQPLYQAQPTNPFGRTKYHHHHKMQTNIDWYNIYISLERSSHRNVHHAHNQTKFTSSTKYCSFEWFTSFWSNKKRLLGNRQKNIASNREPR